MRHRMQPEFAETDPLHLTIRRMELDPVLVAAETIARMKHRRMLVGDFGELVESAACELAEAIEMRLHRIAQPRLHMEIEQLAQPSVDAVKVHAAAIRRNQCSRRIVTRELVRICGSHWKLELIFSRRIGYKLWKLMSCPLSSRYSGLPLLSTHRVISSLLGRVLSATLRAASTPATGRPAGSSKPICTRTEAWSQ